MLIYKVISITTLALALVSGAFAEDESVVADKEKIKKSLEKIFPGKQPDSISPAPVNGLYEVMFGPKLFYISKDARYLIDGIAFDLVESKNVTEPRIAKVRQKIMSGISQDQMINYNAKNEKHIVTVFTDIDCPYCRKFHNEMQAYNELGISIHYLLYPRSPQGSPSYNKAVSVWCADDRPKALTEAKQGAQVETRTCGNPIGQNQGLGKSVGVTGTPTIVLPSGEVLPGYLPPAQLIKRLEPKD